MNKAFGRWRWIVGVISLVLVVVLSLWWLTGIRLTDRDGTDSNMQNLAQFLSADPDGNYADVTGGYRLQFPRDHGAHPTYRQEWWYFTGNLDTDDGRKFGYQLTFFRFAHGANQTLEQGGWNSDQSWMSHFAVTDVTNNTFIAEQDFARGGLGLADATSLPFAVWVNGWSGRAPNTDCNGCFEVALHAESEGYAVRLQLETEHNPVLHGVNGFSAKNQDKSVASYYYSYPDFKTTGSLRIGENLYAVAGTSWMDHEWSSAVLAKGQSGWDWFALHFDDGRRMMLYQVRHTDGDNFQYAVMIDAADNKKPEPFETLELTATDYWTSPVTGNRYPVAWLIDGANISIEVESEVADQELDLLITYYEGAMRFTGTLDGELINGRGYMELTGYEK